MQVIYPEKITTAATPQEAVGAAQPVDTPLAVTKPAIMPRMAEIDCECKKAMQRKKAIRAIADCGIYPVNHIPVQTNY